jgi:hypothetical protein
VFRVATQHPGLGAFAYFQYRPATSHQPPQIRNRRRIYKTFVTGVDGILSRLFPIKSNEKLKDILGWQSLGWQSLGASDGIADDAYNFRIFIGVLVVFGCFTAYALQTRSKQ